MKNFKTYISLLMLVLVMASSCQKSFIEDVTSPDRIPVDNYYTSQANFNAALTGIYGTLRARYDNFWNLAELPSDNTTQVLGNVNEETFSWNTSETIVQTTWLGYYATIAASNIFLEKIKDFQMDDKLKARWIAEARFIRGMMYFDLVRIYGGVPLVLKSLTDEEAYSYLRESDVNVYKQIEKDLSDAAIDLPVKYTANNDIGRATKGAALGMLAKVYLTQKKYGDVVAVLKDVITPNATGISYSLLNNYADIFSTANENNAEILFSVQYTKGIANEGSNFTRNFYPANSTILTSLTGIGLNQGTPNLFNAFEAGDQRKAATIKDFVSGKTTSYYTLKYIDQPLAQNQGESNWIVLRYSDVLLMQAEALNELDDPTAIDYLNQVRRRAVLGNKSFSNKENLRLDIEKERRVELCFEGQRWFDLIRTGRMVTVVKAQLTADKMTYASNVTATRALFPIPFRERTLNTNLTQNDGY